MGKEENLFRIDVHHHIAPKEYINLIDSIGITHAGNAPFTVFEVQKTIEMMDRNRIQKAITSISSPGVYFGNQQFTKKLARICNEYSARLKNDFSRRFGTFAVLPLPSVEDSLCELEYVYDVLNVDGIGLMTSYEGIYLGDERFDTVFEELNRRHSVVFIHPVVPPSGRNSPIAVPGYTLEFVFDTTRAVTNLVAKGTLERYPNIKFILSHAGGAVPFLAWRISRGVLATRGADSKQKIDQVNKITKLLQGLYYDTALSTNPYIFKTLFEFVSEKHVLFGSDFPFAKEDVTNLNIKEIDTYPDFDKQVRRNIYCENSLTLFPSLQEVL